MKTVNDIRTTFLEYFRRQGHNVVASSSLVPQNDPTLMFVNSGMVQFKNLFTRLETRDYSRATTAQKCVRAGGKHNDLDNVGHTNRHHTFFEMLGNFSFGDYFKDDAIRMAWEVVTKEFSISPERLCVTVYHDDHEAAEIWKKVTGFSDDKIIRIATSDNFWMMGSTGPCGPCSEIFYDHGDHIWGGPPGTPEEDGDRFVEIWNLVFMQFEQQSDGSRRPLPQPSIDTGMGIERVAALLQGSNDNYATDLMRHLIETSASISGTDPDGPVRTHHRVIVDHLRSSAFLIADGVMPSNDGRGYVLRRIMRRALRHIHQLGSKDPMFYRLVPALANKMGAAYPELLAAQALISETLEQEEIRFKKMLDRGLKLLDSEIEALQPGGEFSGSAAFQLYDTYGFPLDLTQDVLRERELKVNVEDFETIMAQKKQEARAAWKGAGDVEASKIWFDIADRCGASEFLGYEQEKTEATVLALVKDGQEVASAEAGDVIQLVTNQSVFFAESGGQLYDTGWITTPSARLEVTDTQKTVDLIIHTAHVRDGKLAAGDFVVLEIDHARRGAIRANHSATHLLHEALRQTLGEQVAQRGSLNAADRLRFDFNHRAAMTEEELLMVESDVNRMIRQNTEVETRIMSPDAARELGAQALFGEKYGDEVRVVAMGHAKGAGKGLSGETYSLELCGGTHVKYTGDIGAFVIKAESSSSTGIRRIEALTGAAAISYLREKAQILQSAAQALKTQPDMLCERIETLLKERSELASAVQMLKRQTAIGKKNQDDFHCETVNGIGFISAVLEGVSGKDLLAIIDAKKNELKSGVVFLIAVNDGRAAVALGVSEDLSARFNAKDMIAPAVQAMGGKGGGGRADLAQGGAPKPDLAGDAIAAIRQILEKGT